MKDGSGEFRITDIASHQRRPLTGYKTFGRDEETGMFHRTPQTTRLTLSAIIIICGNNACLRGGVGIVKTCVGQQAAEFFHIALHHGGSTRLQEIYLGGIALQTLTR